MLLNCSAGENSWVHWAARRSNKSILKGKQPWIFIGRTDDEAETPILWPPDVKNWLMWKDPDAGKVWRQEEKGTTEDEIVGWHHQLYGHEFEETLGAGDGEGGRVCCSPWGRKQLDTTERLNWTELLFLSPCPVFLPWYHIIVTSLSVHLSWKFEKLNES